MENMVIIKASDYDSLKAAYDELMAIKSGPDYFNVSIEYTFTKCGSVEKPRLEGISKDDAVKLLVDQIEELQCEIRVLENQLVKRSFKDQHAPKPWYKKLFN